MPFPITGTDPANMEARLAVMRLASSRLGYMNPVLRLTIGGTDRTAKVLKETIRVMLSSEGPSSAAFTVYGFEPIKGQTIVLAVGAIGNAMFAGTITKVSLLASTSASMHNVRYAVQCQDYTWLLNRRQVMRQYASDNVESILADLITNFSTGFTTKHVNQGLGFLTGPTPFTMETVSSCIRRLAKQVSAYWYVDATQDLHFFAAGQDRVPQPHALTTAYIDYENLRLETDLTSVITRMYGEGVGTTLSATAPLSGISFFVTVPENSMFPDTTFDIRLGNYAPVNGRRFRASKSGTTQISYAINQATDYLPYDDLQAMYPFPIGTTVNLWKMVEDTTAQAALAALEGGDGIHEDYIQDRRLGQDGLTSAITGELNRRKNPVETLRYRTHDPCSKPGSLVTVTSLPINLPTPQTLTGTYTIQSVTISGLEKAHDHHPWYEVVASSQQRSLWDILLATRLIGRV
jgi:hypothetical protein